jgi:molecular chaperone DnaJ
MTTKRDYYDILGVDRSSDEGAIKSAYRKKAMQYHPDRNPGNKEAEEQFKEATEAYEVLKDTDKRRMYDQYGHAGVNQQGGFGGGFSGGFEGFDLSDALRAFMRDFGGGSMFEDMFDMGSGRGRGGRGRGEDLRIRISLTLEEIATGVEKTIKVNRLVACQVCDGSGIAAGSSKKTCPQCRGAGQVRTMTRTFLGTIQQVSTCSMCRGAGEVIADPCKTCAGEGRIKGTSTVNLKVPAGVASGNYMAVDNMGNAAARGGETGNLMVVFDEMDHKQFTRHGDNIIYQMPISFMTAALGGEVTVPTLAGFEQLTIPPGTQSGKVLKLRGKGIPHVHHSGKGDLLVQVTVWVPSKLSTEDKKLLAQLAHSETFKPPATDKSFFEKLRETLGV